MKAVEAHETQTEIGTGGSDRPSDRVSGMPEGGARLSGGEETTVFAAKLCPPLNRFQRFRLPTPPPQRDDVWCRGREDGGQRQQKPGWRTEKTETKTATERMNKQRQRAKVNV